MRSGEVTFIQAARRAQIVQGAIEVVAEIGWAKTSIRKIADHVGLAMSAVLYHFGTKDKLVEAIIEAMYAAAFDIVGPAIERETTAHGKLAAYIRASVTYFDTHRTHLAALTQIATGIPTPGGRSIEDLRLSDEVAERIAALDPRAILAAGQADGEFRDFPVESLAIALRGAVNAVVEKILREPEFDAWSYGEDLVRIFGDAVAAP
jgi:AcrR family transcriptional regulator